MRRRVLTVAAYLSVVVAALVSATTLSALADLETVEPRTTPTSLVESDQGVHVSEPETPDQVTKPVPASPATEPIPIRLPNVEPRTEDAPPAPPVSPAPPESLEQRARRYLDESLPPAWRAAVPVANIVVIPGCTSRSEQGTAKIMITACQMALGHAPWVVIHEWGHQVAFRFGTHASLGAPPSGFPSSNVEAWADCAADVFVGPAASVGSPRDLCADPTLLGWARTFYAAGPPA